MVTLHGNYTNTRYPGNWTVDENFVLNLTCSDPGERCVVLYGWQIQDRDAVSGGAQVTVSSFHG